MAVTHTQLTAFLAVVRHGSVTAAAQELYVTQPSVSAAVAALERELGVELTERAGRNVRPTAAGREYARYASHVVGLLKEGSEVAGRVAAGAEQRLRLAAVLTAGEHLMPALIQNFREHRPELHLSLSVANRQEVFRSLAAHEVDLVVDGELTIKGVTRSVPLTVEVGGFGPDAYGGTRAGFSGTTSINRSDFGVDIQMPLDGGGVVVGEKVQIHLEIEAVLRAA